MRKSSLHQNQMINFDATYVYTDCCFSWTDRKSIITKDRVICPISGAHVEKSACTLFWACSFSKTHIKSLPFARRTSIIKYSSWGIFGVAKDDSMITLSRDVKAWWRPPLATFDCCEYSSVVKGWLQIKETPEVPHQRVSFGGFLLLDVWHILR